LLTAQDGAIHRRTIPEALKRYVRERTKPANYSNPSDYARSLIREGQRRQAATSLPEDLATKHIAANPEVDVAKLGKLRAVAAKGWRAPRRYGHGSHLRGGGHRS